MATMKDPYTNENVEVPDELTGFITNITNFNRRKGKEGAQKDIDALQEKIDSMAEQVEAAKKAGAGSGKELEALKKDYEKKLADLTGERDTLKTSASDYENKYMDTRMRSELFSKLPVGDLHNVEDTLEKVKRNAKWKTIHDAAKGEDTGERELLLTLPVKDDKTGRVKMVDFAPEEGIKHFLADSGNAYLLKNKLSPGSAASGGDNGQGITLEQGRVAVKRSDFEKMSVAARAELMTKHAGKVDMTD